MFSITRNERRWPHGNQYVPHRHHHDEFLLVLEGSGTELRNETSRPFRGKMLCFYPAGLPHNTHTVRGQSYVCYVLSCTAACFRDALGEQAEPRDALARLTRSVHQAEEPRLPLSTDALQKIETLFHRLHRLLSDPSDRRAWRQRLAFEEMLQLVDAELFQPRSTRQPEDWIADACEQIRARFQEPLTVRDMLAVCPMSRSRFFTAFRAATGCTFGEYLTRQRLGHARMLLEQTDLPITHIAYECGFGSYSHFCLVFRTHTGEPPGTYRARLAAGPSQ